MDESDGGVQPSTRTLGGTMDDTDEELTDSEGFSSISACLWAMYSDGIELMVRERGKEKQNDNNDALIFFAFTDFLRKESGRNL